MPYGIDKKLGGDSPSNVKWMEKCVKRVMMGEKLSKGRAIAICKNTLRKIKEKNQ
jgi:hypothetical protein